MAVKIFSYNPTQAVISGVTNIGTLAIGTGNLYWADNPGGLTWWMGPDESLGFVIGGVVTGYNQPTQVGSVGNVQFWRTQTFSDSEFLDLANYVKRQAGGDPDLATASAAVIWLNSNSYYTNWTPSTTTTTTTSPSNQIISSNLFVHLDASQSASYPGSGSTWTDLTGNGNNATINGATWLDTDSGIFDLDGSNDTISIPHVSQLSLSTSAQRTVQVWVKFDALPESGKQVPVFGKLSNASGFDGYWGGLFSNTGTVRCVTNGTAVQRISTSTLTVTTNTWYLFTFVSQITGTSNTTKVYINNTEYITAAHGTDSYGETNPLYLGFIGSGVGSLYLNGKIGACYFYTSGLTSDNVLTNFNATKSRYGL